MPIANQFKKSEDSADNFRFKLSTSFCSSCLLFQIDEQPSPEQMFHDTYPFFTGLSTSMRQHFELYAKEVLSGRSSQSDFVVEIGCNDGTMLQEIKKYSKQHLGVDPSKNVVELATSKGLNAVAKFFNEQTANEISSEFGHAEFILAANVICHIKDLSGFLDGVNTLLTTEGQFIFEEPYILSMLEKTSYDQIYDEHVYIFGTLSVEEVFSRKGLRLVDAVPQHTHGGSMRYFVTKNEFTPKSERLLRLLERERNYGLETLKPYLEFAKSCQNRKVELL
jgi:methylation protein EvaC